MAIEINEFINSIFNVTHSNKGLYRIFSSILYTAILLSIICLIFMIFILPGRKDTPAFLYVKFMLYITLSAAFIFMIHKNMVRKELEKKYEDKNAIEILGGMESNGRIYNDDIVTVKPAASEYIVDNAVDDTPVEDMIVELENQLR